MAANRPIMQTVGRRTHERNSSLFARGLERNAAIYEAIRSMPFNAELASGSLSEARLHGDDVLRDIESTLVTPRKIEAEWIMIADHRRARLIEAMAEADLDMLLVYGNACRSTIYATPLISVSSKDRRWRWFAMMGISLSISTALSRSTAPNWIVPASM